MISNIHFEFRRGVVNRKLSGADLVDARWRRSLTHSGAELVRSMFIFSLGDPNRSARRSYGSLLETGARRDPTATRNRWYAELAP